VPGGARILPAGFARGRRGSLVALMCQTVGDKSGTILRVLDGIRKTRVPAAPPTHPPPPPPLPRGLNKTTCRQDVAGARHVPPA